MQLSFTIRSVCSAFNGAKYWRRNDWLADAGAPGQEGTKDSQQISPTFPTITATVKPTSPRKTKLTYVERQQILWALMLRSVNEHRRCGDLSAIAAEENIHPSTIYRLWAHARAEKVNTGHFESPLCRDSSGRPDADHTPMLERLRRVPVEERSIVHSAATACGMAPTTLYGQLGQGNVRVCTSVGETILMETNKLHRLQFSVSHINRETMIFDTMMSTVHVDEKIFYITQPTRRYLLRPDEMAPVRRLRRRRYITRVMFLSAVGRPRYEPTTQQFFDGKLGIWPFVEQEPAQRSSARRPTGMIITKDISVTKTSDKSILIANVLPALCSRWPPSMNGKPIIIQQDNAPAHIAADDVYIAESAAAAAGCSVMLRNQPPNSPDLNVSDLGLFSAIQARQRKKRAHT